MKKKTANTPAPIPIDVASLTMRKLSLGDLIILEDLGIDLFGGSMETPSIGTLTKLAFVASTPCDECHALFDQGKAVFEKAVLAFADRIPPGQATLLIEKLGAMMKASMETERAHLASTVGGVAAAGEAKN